MVIKCVCVCINVCVSVYLCAWMHQKERDLRYFKSTKMVLKTIKAFEASQGDGVLSYVGPCELSAACVYPSPHVHQDMGADQRLQMRLCMISI